MKIDAVTAVEAVVEAAAELVDLAENACGAPATNAVAYAKLRDTVNALGNILVDRPLRTALLLALIVELRSSETRG